MHVQSQSHSCTCARTRTRACTHQLTQTILNLTKRGHPIIVARVCADPLICSLTHMLAHAHTHLDLTKTSHLIVVARVYIHFQVRIDGDPAPHQVCPRKSEGTHTRISGCWQSHRSLSIISRLNPPGTGCAVWNRRSNIKIFWLDS